MDTNYSFCCLHHVNISRTILCVLSTAIAPGAVAEQDRVLDTLRNGELKFLSFRNVDTDYFQTVHGCTSNNADRCDQVFCCRLPLVKCNGEAEAKAYIRIC